MADRKFSQFVEATTIELNDELVFIDVDLPLPQQNRKITVQNFIGLGGIDLATNTDLQAHISDLANPHNVTAAQVGNNVALWNANQIQNIIVDASAPSDGGVLRYSLTLNRWVPSVAPAVFGDLVSTNNLSDVANSQDALNNLLGGVPGTNGINTFNNVIYANSFTNLASLPTAASYPGFFGYAIAEDAAYYSYGGGYRQLLDSTTSIPNATINLLDVSSTPATTTGEILLYSGTAFQYQPQFLDTDLVPEASNLYYTDTRVNTFLNNASINELNDVDTVTFSPAPGQALTWDGLNWVPGAVSSVSSLSDLTDVAFPVGLADGQVLQYDITDFRFENVSLAAAITNASVPISALVDVDPAGAINNSILAFNTTGSVWEVSDLPTLAADLELNDISDVNAVAPADEDFLVYNLGATEWQNIAPTTALIAEDPSNLYYTDARVQLNTLDSLAAPVADVDLNANKITGLAAPTLPDDAARLTDVQEVQEGLRSKVVVKYATLSNIASIVTATQATIQAALDTISGVAPTLLTGDRVLVKNQSTASENGLYEYDASLNGAAGGIQRTTDLDGGATGLPSDGLYTRVLNGDVHQDQTFALGDTTGLVIGTGLVNWLQVGGVFNKQETLVVASSAGALTIDTRLANNYVLVLTENITSITVSNIDEGTNFNLHVAQDGTGGWTVAGWPSNVLFPGGLAPVFTATPLAEDLVVFSASNVASLKGVTYFDFS